ncbi:MAG: carbohydrate-binding domain-containing protein [Lachnospiraceae bacterium]|nr:carbohydrate-binding domain-containing protein [Lachnospiraceae bacterium]
MSTHKSIDRICILVIVLTLVLTVVFMNGEKLGITVVADEDAESYTGSGHFTSADLEGSWDDNSFTTYIELTGDGASIRGNGAYAYDGGVVIAGAGWYVLSGTINDGSIVVDAYDSSKVRLRLEGVDVNCSDNACLIVKQADKVFLTLAEGTENSFASGESYSDSALSDNTGGVIYAHDDLTINGSGELTITASYKHGIDANDSLTITGGRVSITAPADGIHVNDDFSFTGADLTITAGDDAIHTGREIYTEGGTILVNDCYEGLEASAITVAGGDITVFSRDDGFNAASGDSEERVFGESSSNYIRISGGNVTIINETGKDADGLDSNGDIYLEGGTVFISLKGDGSNCALDCGSESGGKLIATGGTVVACGGSSMAEAFSSDSTQCAVLFNTDNVNPAGTVFKVLDPEGKEVLSYTPVCSFSSIAFTSPALKEGETYSVCIGEDTSDLALSSTSTTVGQTGGFGGGFGGGFSGDSAGDPPGNPPEGFDGDRPDGFPGDFPGGDGEGRGSFPGGRGRGRSDSDDDTAP